VVLPIDETRGWCLDQVKGSSLTGDELVQRYQIRLHIQCESLVVPADIPESQDFVVDRQAMARSQPEEGKLIQSFRALVCRMKCGVRENLSQRPGNPIV
jgi:hypothetical protein